jgi:hypothetical protein
MVAAERLALIFGAFAFPVLAIALGICLAILEQIPVDFTRSQHA